MSQATVILADDDPSICTVVEQAIREQGWGVMSTNNGKTLLDWVKSGKGDVVITDVLMPGMTGFDALPTIKQMRPTLPVIVISAQNTLMTAVRANQLGASEYLPKPFDLNALMGCVDKMLKQRKNGIVTPDTTIVEHGLLIGRSPAMQEVYRVLARVVDTDLTVLIEGESGTGKELVARSLHELSTRKSAPFVAINMAAIPRELVESELFGYEKGAFTGAQGRKAGKFELAEGGTLFFDEIGDMPLDAQTKLLRVLQEGEYTAVGGHNPLKTNVRIICATHHDLMQLTKTGAFREDLYYRLNVVPLHIPPLRDRREDIPELSEFFLKKGAERGLKPKRFHSGAIARMQDYSWPGNVRELENFIYRLAAIHADAILTAETVESELSDTSAAAPALLTSGRPFGEVAFEYLKQYFDSHTHGLPAPGVYDRVIPIVEKTLIDLTLERTKGNQIKAAQILGINRNTLRKKIQELKVADYKKL